MKTILNTIFESLVAWGEAIAEYRKNKASHHYY
jgi:hypothetical protein